LRKTTSQPLTTSRTASRSGPVKQVMLSIPISLAEDWARISLCSDGRMLPGEHLGAGRSGLRWAATRARSRALGHGLRDPALEVVDRVPAEGGAVVTASRPGRREAVQGPAQLGLGVPSDDGVEVNGSLWTAARAK